MFLLDVTLRDGGHCCDFNFSPSFVDNLLSLIDRTGVEYVEVGYRNGYLGEKQKLGQAGYCTDDYLSRCRNKLVNSQMAVMAHPHLIDIDDIYAMKLHGVDILRLCVSPTANITELMRVMEMCHSLYLPISVNITHVSQYQLDYLIDKLKAIVNAGTNWLYLADSNGSCLPETIKVLFKKLKREFNISLGFHGHDNLGLAQTNAIVAIESGAAMIDGSLNGLGKGGGNLKLERFIAYLAAIQAGTYDLKAIVHAQQLISTEVKSNYALPDIIRGIEDLSSLEFSQKYLDH